MTTTATTRITATSSRAIRLLIAFLTISLAAAACSSESEFSSEPAPSNTTGAPPAETADDDVAAAETTAAPATNEDDAACSAQIEGAARVDIRADGNRLHPGALDLANATATDVVIEGTPEWILPDPSAPGSWYVSLDDGTYVRALPNGSVEPAPRAPSGPPMLSAAGEPLSIFIDHQRFAAPLTDGRVVASGTRAVMLSDGTDRYGHAVLGDVIEAGGIEWVDLCTGESGEIEIDAPDVIEGTAPMLADIDNDGEPEILVTLSNSSDGARLAAYEFDGTVLAESEPIGQGNRWRNQLAIGPFGPSGELEIIDVRTPHIGGTVQAFQLVDEDDSQRLERVAASGSDYTSHVIGSRNLDMGIAVDADADGHLDVVVARSDLRQIVALTRTTDSRGWEVVAERSIDDRLTTNIAVQDTETGTAIAVGYEGRIRIWG